LFSRFFGLILGWSAGLPKEIISRQMEPFKGQIFVHAFDQQCQVGLL